MATHWGPAAAWTAMFVAAALLAPTEYLRRTFTSKETFMLHQKELCTRCARIEERIERLDQHIQEREQRQEQRLAELASGTRIAVRVSTRAGDDAQHLSVALRQLTTRLDTLYRWKLLEECGDLLAGRSRL